MSETQLAKIKRRLGIAQDDTAENDLLADLVDDAESYFKTLTGSVEIGSKYNFMIAKVRRVSPLKRLTATQSLIRIGITCLSPTWLF